MIYFRDRNIYFYAQKEKFVIKREIHLVVSTSCVACDTLFFNVFIPVKILNKVHFVSTWAQYANIFMFPTIHPLTTILEFYFSEELFKSLKVFQSQPQKKKKFHGGKVISSHVCRPFFTYIGNHKVMYNKLYFANSTQDRLFISDFLCIF